MNQIFYLLTQCNKEDVLYTVYVGRCPLRDICTESVKTP